MKHKTTTKNVIYPSIVIAGMTTSTLAGAVSFVDIAAEPSTGINYLHPQTSRHEDRLTQFFLPSMETPLTLVDIANMPLHVPGKGGVLLLDYDNDGDVDIFATNVAGTPNSLFQNQLSQTGQLTFMDVAALAGIDSPDHQGGGACYADIDNDGDHDIFVVGDDDSHKLYENSGNGTFNDITIDSGSTLTSSPKGGSMCAFGDVDNDGLVDLHVAHAWDFDTSLACFAEPFAFNIANELFQNNGDNTFSDISDSSGIRQLGVLPPGSNGITWAVAMVDYDQDGDVDLFNLDDNCSIPPTAFGGVDRGLIQIWDNDGQGNFTNITAQAGTDSAGQWMGLDFADFNHDGNLDFFASNMGDYMLPLMNPLAPLGQSASRMFLGNDDGTFDDPGAGSLVATPFGWGVLAEDFDNDGDTDVMFGGGIDIGVVITDDNPDALLLNDGTANLSYEDGALGNRGTQQNVQGIAAGDLNNDGFVDLVTTANLNIPDFFPLVPAPLLHGGPFDATALFVPQLSVSEDSLFSWTGLLYEPGTMRVEINQPSTEYASIAVQTMGSVGLTSQGSVNRDGIGAIVSFTPANGNTAIKPVTGGNSHVSQSTHQLNFGLGEAKQGTLDILWPGGVRNRLYNVRKGATVIFPEIPCSIDTDQIREDYVNCVHEALRELENAGVIDTTEKGRFIRGALRGYNEEHPEAQL